VNGGPISGVPKVDKSDCGFAIRIYWLMGVGGSRGSELVGL
jgi:hypothetical protein